MLNTDQVNKSEKSRADWPTITVKERPDAEQLAIKTRRRSQVVRNTTTDRAERAFRQSQSSGSISAATTENRLTPSEHITAEENHQGKRPDPARLRPSPTTVPDTSVRDPDIRTTPQERNIAGTTQITRSLASSTQPTEQDQSERTRQSAGTGSPDEQRVAGY